MNLKMFFNFYECRKDVAVLDKFGADGICTFSFKKHAFAGRIFIFMLVYRQQFIRMQGFFQLLQYIIATNFIDIIVGGFNYDLFIDNVQIVNKLTYVSESLMDHVFIKKMLMAEFSTNATVENIYFSDQDTGRIVIEKNSVDFHTDP